MSRLPRISGRECVRALERAGFYSVRQKGSHITVRRDEPLAQTVVPDHRELAPGTLKRILRDTRIPLDTFLELL